MDQEKTSQAPPDVSHETRHEFFIRRLKELELYEESSDYDGLIGQWVEELSIIFAAQGHSGMSAEITLGVFRQLFEEWKQGGRT